MSTHPRGQDVPIISFATTMIQCSSATTLTPNYRSIFDSALDVYRKKTKSDLASHPLLTKIESCGCPEAVLTTLRREILAFDQARSSNNKSSTWLNSTVNVLYTFSSTIGESVGLVCFSDVFKLIILMITLTDIPPCGVDFHGYWHPSFGEDLPVLFVFDIMIYMSFLGSYRCRH
jgi:hypothetical protein